KTLLDYVWKKPGKGWMVLLLMGLGGTGLLTMAIAITVAKGIGMWGTNIPVAWAFGIINFVWWIGIGHAGTLISAILLLFQQKWRTSINRCATARPTGGSAASTVCSRSGGADRLGTGSTTRSRICCSRAWRHRWCCPSTPS